MNIHVPCTVPDMITFLHSVKRSEHGSNLCVRTCIRCNRFCVWPTLLCHDRTFEILRPRSIRALLVLNTDFLISSGSIVTSSWVFEEESFPRFFVLARCHFAYARKSRSSINWRNWMMKIRKIERFFCFNYANAKWVEVIGFEYFLLAVVEIVLYIKNRVLEFYTVLN